MTKKPEKRRLMKTPKQAGPKDPVFVLPPYKVEQVFTAQSETIDWGIELVGVPSLWRQVKGEGIKVAVLDTGIALEHPDLRDAIEDAADFTGSRSGPGDVQGHGCLLPSELVYSSMCGLQCISDLFRRVDSITHFLDDGSIIKDVSRLHINTLSMNSDGATVPRRLMAVHKLPYVGSIIKVKTREGELGLTPWHPVFIVTSRRGHELSIKKVRADNLKVGDAIVSATESQDFADYLEIPYKITDAIESIRLDEDLAYLAGLVASDGHLRKKRSQYKVEFYSKDDRIGHEFCLMVEKIFDKIPHYKPGTIRYSFDSKIAHNVLETIGVPIGNKSKSLRFPELISKSPRSVIFSFLAGIIDGDGSVSDAGRIRIGTGSKQFAVDIVALLRTLGVRSSYCECDLSKAGFGGSDYYMVRVGYSERLYTQLRIKKPTKHPSRTKRQSASIVDIAIEHYDGYMYDFTVDGNHNYIANGLVVSNTHCAGTIAARENSTGVIGVAPNCRLLIGKVLGDNGSGTIDDIVKGINWAVSKKADIISMSLGSPMDSSELHKAIQDAVAHNVFVICAAGNEGPSLDTVGYPGRYEEVVAVGAIDRNKNVANFSSRGSQVDVVAPGDKILSCYPPRNLAVLSGTCIAKGSYVYGPVGPKKIEEIGPGDVVYAFKDGKVVERPVYANFYRGKNETHRLSASGRHVSLTSGHQVLAVNTNDRDLEWVEAQHLQNHHRLLMPKQLPSLVNPYLDSILSEGACRVLGFFAGDGWLGNTTRGKRVCFATGDKPITIDNIRSIYQTTFGKLLTNNEKGTWCYDDSTMTALIIEALGMSNKANKKNVPLWLWSLPAYKQDAFLQGYLAADGHVADIKSPKARSAKFAFECTSEDLIKRIACLCDYRGWSHTIVWSRTRLSKAPHMKDVKLSTSHCVRIGFDEPYGGWSILRSGSNRTNGRQNAADMGIDVDNMFMFAPKFGEQPSEQVDVYDLCVPNADCFVTQGLITHNSMATPLVAGVCALMLAKHNTIGTDDPVHSPKKLIERLYETAIDLGPSGYDPSYGAGLINPSQLLVGNISSEAVLLLNNDDISASGAQKLADFYTKFGKVDEITLKFSDR